MDVWMTSCMGFLVLTLIEFALVNSIARHYLSIRRRMMLYRDQSEPPDLRAAVNKVMHSGVRHRKDNQVRVRGQFAHRLIFAYYQTKRAQVDNPEGSQLYSPRKVHSLL